MKTFNKFIAEGSSITLVGAIPKELEEFLRDTKARGISIGKGSVIGKNTRIGDNCTIGKKCTLEDEAIMLEGSSMTDGAYLVRDYVLPEKSVYSAKEKRAKEIITVLLRQLGGKKLSPWASVGSEFAINYAIDADELPLFFLDLFNGKKVKPIKYTMEIMVSDKESHIVKGIIDGKTKNFLAAINEKGFGNSNFFIKSLETNRLTIGKEKFGTFGGFGNITVRQYRIYYDFINRLISNWG